MLQKLVFKKNVTDVVTFLKFGEKLLQKFFIVVHHWSNIYLPIAND